MQISTQCNTVSVGYMRQYSVRYI